MIKRIFAIAIIFIIFLSGCKGEANDATPVLAEPVKGKMDTAIVSRGDIFELTTYYAKVYPDLNIIYPALDGAIKEVVVYLGQDVKEGDVLAYLDDARLTERIKNLEDTIEDTRINNDFNNQQQELDIQIKELNIRQKIADNAPELEIAQMRAELEKLEVLRQQNLKKQEYDLKKLQEQLAEANEELDNTVIKATSSGRVVYISSSYSGVYVGKDSPFIIITDESKLHIQGAYMDRNTYINAGEVYAAINGKNYEVEYVPLESEQVKKMEDNGITIESRFEIKGEASEISSGDFACICVKNKVKENVLNIPQNAIFSDDAGKFVYRYSNGTFTRCNIVTGIETDIQIEIISGLEEGDVIYVQGS